jgi:hypothetical protein
MTSRQTRRATFRERLLAGSLLVSHFLAYCAAVCAFVVINMFLGGEAWFQWPCLAWGIVLVAHVFTVVIAGARRAQLDG